MEASVWELDSVHTPNLLKEAFYHSPRIQENTSQTMPLCATSKLSYSMFSTSEQIGTRKEMAKVNLKRREKATEIRIRA